MINIDFIRKNPEAVQKGAAAKGVKININLVLAADRKYRLILKKIEDLRAYQKKVSERISMAAPQDKKKLIKEAAKIKKDLKSLTPELEKTKKNLESMLYQIPNMPASDVKIGKDATENEIIRQVGEKTKFPYKPLEAHIIGEIHDIIDTKRAAKVSGSRFGYLKGEVALLELALIKYAFDLLIPEGFQPIIPPSLVGERAMIGTGYLDREREETYYIPKDELYLVATSEHAVGPMHMDEILREDELPKRYLAFSTCFRREAGSYGKDVKGILRVHQFDKVEMFSFTKPNESDKEQEYFLSLQERFMQNLGIPYQVVKMCSGDLGTSAARKYDIESWLPGTGQYRETHSLSNTTDFQTRRWNIRCRLKESKYPVFVHAVNGTACAIGRTIIAILENYQQNDRTVKIPKVLIPYCKFEKIPR